MLLVATAAQDLPAAQGAAVADSGGLFRTRDVVLLASLAAAHVALLPFDDDVRRQTQGMRGGVTHSLAEIVEPFGRSSAWYQASAGTFVVGTILRKPTVADIGLHVFISLALANTVTSGLKSLSGRSRPGGLLVEGADTTAVDRSPYSWKLLGGWGDGGRRSYPSLHSTTAFAVASALSEELGGPVPWIAYPIAGAVAWSRVYHGAHWASDVTMGALVGIFSSRVVVRYGHRHGGPLERWLLIETDPTDGSARLGFQIRCSAGRC